MNAERISADDLRIQRAVTELQDMIHRRYPSATFTVGPGEDPEGVHVTAVVEVDDTDEVVDVIIERLVALQVDERLPVYVFPIRPLDWVLRELRAQKPRRRPAYASAAITP